MNEQFFNRTENGAIWGLIALFLTNQNAGITIDFKMNVIKSDMNVFASLSDVATTSFVRGGNIRIFLFIDHKNNPFQKKLIMQITSI